MIYITIISALILLALWATVPKINVVHAARAKPSDSAQRRRVSPMKFYRDTDGNRINMKNKFVGLVEGNSCVKYGIPNKATVLADKLHIVSPPVVAEGDLVIIDAEAITGASRNRFRKVASVHGGTINFEPDSHGGLDPRPIGEIFAKVTHVNRMAI